MGDNMMISSSSSSSLLSPPTLEKKLQNLLQNQQQWWNYAIFWQACTNINLDDICSVSLVWGDGYFHGIKNPSTSKPNFLIKDHDHDHDHFDGSISSSIDDVISNTEWFFMTSPSKSYPIKQTMISNETESSIPTTLAKAFTNNALVWLSGAHLLRSCRCERAKEALSHGLLTLVCIHVPNGVIELGSMDLIMENKALIQQVRCLFEQTTNLDAASLTGNYKVVDFTI